jgi:hypothetical protein
VALKDPKITEKDLEEFCKNSPRLARYQRPRYYKICDIKELPFNPAGKKLHYLIKERAKKDFPNSLAFFALKLKCRVDKQPWETLRPASNTTTLTGGVQRACSAERSTELTPKSRVDDTSSRISSGN